MCKTMWTEKTADRSSICSRYYAYGGVIFVMFEWRHPLFDKIVFFKCSVFGFIVISLGVKFW